MKKMEKSSWRLTYFIFDFTCVSEFSSQSNEKKKTFFFGLRSQVICTSKYTWILCWGLFRVNWELRISHSYSLIWGQSWVREISNWKLLLSWVTYIKACLSFYIWKSIPLWCYEIFYVSMDILVGNTFFTYGNKYAERRKILRFHSKNIWTKQEMGYQTQS